MAVEQIASGPYNSEIVSKLSTAALIVSMDAV